MNQELTPTLTPIQELSRLRLEIRAVSKRAHRAAMRASRNGESSYRDALRAYYNGTVQMADSRQRMVAFASAVEMHSDLAAGMAVDCRATAEESAALGALFWAASRRLHRRAAITAMR